MSELRHPTGTSWGEVGFNEGSLYDAARPRYPVAALELVVSVLGLDATSRVVDLGAGSGIFTRQIAPFVAEVVAVEPSASMRDAFRAADPDLEVLDGRDVAVPIRDGWADAVVVAQAFHWFDGRRALHEMHRVLRPGGGIALLWNDRDESEAWVRDFHHAMRWDEFLPRDASRDYVAEVSAGPFDDVARVRVDFRETLSHEQLVRRALTSSYVTVMVPEERERLVAAVREVLATLPDPVVVPHQTDIVTAVARPLD